MSTFHIHSLAFISNFGGMDGLIVLAIALLLFGKRLPDVGKNLGKTIVEFKKGLSGGSTPPEEDRSADAQQEERPARRPVNRISAGSETGDRPIARPRRSLPSQTEEV